MKLVFFALVAVFAAIHIVSAGPLRLNKRAAFYIANETACVVDSIVFYNGDPIPTDDPCEACKCRPPGFACVLKECEPKPGCRAVRKAGHCCPDYICDSFPNETLPKDNSVSLENLLEVSSVPSTSQSSIPTNQPSTQPVSEEGTSKAENREIADPSEATTRQATTTQKPTSVETMKTFDPDNQESKSQDEVKASEEQSDLKIASTTPSEVNHETSSPPVPSSSAPTTTEKVEITKSTKVPVLFNSNLEIKSEDPLPSSMPDESTTIKVITVEEITEEHKETEMPVTSIALEEREESIKEIKNDLSEDAIRKPTTVEIQSEDPSSTPITVEKPVENSAAEHGKNLKFHDEEKSSEKEIKSTTIAESSASTKLSDIPEVSEVPTTILSVESRSEETSMEEKKSSVNVQDPESSTESEKLSSEITSTQKSADINQDLKPDAGPKKEVVLSNAVDNHEKLEPSTEVLSTVSPKEMQPQTTTETGVSTKDATSTIVDSKEKPSFFKSSDEVIRTETGLKSEDDTKSQQATTTGDILNEAIQQTTMKPQSSESDLEKSSVVPTEEKPLTPKARLEEHEKKDVETLSKMTSKSEEIKDTTLAVDIKSTVAGSEKEASVATSIPPTTEKL